MNSSRKTAIIVIAILLIPALVGLGYFLWNKKRKQTTTTSGDSEDADGNSASTSTSSTTTTTTTSSDGLNFPVKYNPTSKNNTVKKVQEALNEELLNDILAGGNGPELLEVDGYYGNNTANAVKYFYGGDGKTFTRDMYNELKK